MSVSRRGAFRLTLGRPGTLRYTGRAATCVVLDISLTGARVRLMPPVLVPDRVTLRTEIAGEEIALRARLRRAEAGSVLALAFEEPESNRLNRLLQQAQREVLAAGLRPSVERRHTPRGR